MKKIFTGIFTLLLTAGLVFTSQAQFQQPGQQQQQAVDVSESELQKFAKTMNQLQVVQTQAQEEMIGVIEDNGMDVQSFNEMYTQTAQGQTPENVSSDELAQFEQVTEEVMSIQNQTDQKMTRTIEANGLEVDRYQEIFMAVQQDPELQQRLNNMQ